MKTKFVLLLLTAVFAGNLFAAGECVANQAGNFFVSGVLQKSVKEGEEVTIKLVHSVELAPSKEDALFEFATKALQTHPGYFLVDTLVSPAQSTCVKSATGVEI